MRTLLECHNLVVDEVDGRSDYGRDLNVDITRSSRLTGGIIGVQVKGGRSFFRGGQWVIPALPVDWEYWRASTLPIIGMVHDPAEGTVRWINLTHLARSRVLIEDNSFDGTPRSDDLAEVVVSQVLDGETIEEFIIQMEAYLSATADSAYLSLVDLDDTVRREGVFNCWTLGRHDPRPLILLRRMLPTLDGRSLVDAIQVLAHATPHPDIFWTKQNWISPVVKKDVARSFRWSPDELVKLVHAVEMMDDGGVDWERGGLGQSMWSKMVSDPDLCGKLPAAIRTCVESNRLRAAVRLLICYQYLVDDPLTMVETLLQSYPMLAQDEMAQIVLQEMRDFGRLSVY